MDSITSVPERPKLSVFLPSIRTHLHPAFIESIAGACNRHTWEIVFCGPWVPLNMIPHAENCRWLQSWRSPTACAQQAALATKGELLYHTVDDCLFYPGKLSDAIDALEDAPPPTEALCLKYYEDNDSYAEYKKTGIPPAVQYPDSYWQAWTAYQGWPGVKPEWIMGVHFLCYRTLFKVFGGFDCTFDYLTTATKDLVFRWQKTGINYGLFSDTVSVADHIFGDLGEHGPIDYTENHVDGPRFNSMWYFTNDRGVVDCDNWQMTPERWTRRFNRDDIKCYDDLEQKQ